MSRSAPEIVRVDAEHPDERALAAPAEALRRARLVAFPTETVYGLGANALDPAAVSRIFTAKQRPPTNPLIVHLSAAEDAREVVAEWGEVAEKLAEAFWPGPLTLVLPKRSLVPDAITAGLDTVAVRVPAHPVARKLIELAGVPVAAPSANRYTEVSPTRAEHVVDSLGGAVDVVVDAGQTRVGLESTVLSLSGLRPEILRPGMVTRDEIAAICPEVVYRTGASVEEAQSRPSPGLARKHYAPKARLIVTDSPAKWRSREANEATGWLLVRPSRLDLGGPTVVLGDQPSEYAEGLYAALRELDGRGCERIVVESPPRGDAWRAIHDRLARAAS